MYFVSLGSKPLIIIPDRLPITKFEGASKYNLVRRRRSITTVHSTDSSTNELLTDEPLAKKDMQNASEDSSSLVGHAFDNFGDAFDDDFFKSETDHGRSFTVNQDDVEFDPSLTLPPEVYCEFINHLEEACWEVNPAELWSFNRSLIYNLTQEDIIHAINHQLTRLVIFIGL